MLRASIPIIVACVTGFASDPRFDLEGTVTGAKDAGKLRVQLSGIERPFTAVAALEDGQFRFQSLPPGDYTLAIVRDTLGEVRRTIVISPGLADARGVVTADIPFSAGDAAHSETLAMVSVQRLSMPGDAEQSYQQGRERMRRGDIEGALRLYRRAVERAPDFADAWNALGVLAFQRGDLREAERCYRQGTQADPRAFDAALNLGALLLRTGRALDALNYNQRAANGRPLDATAKAQLGINYFQLARFNEAEPYLIEAKTLDPANPMQPQLFLAEIYRQQDKNVHAAAELRELLTLRPDGPAASALLEKIQSLSRTEY